MKRQQDDIEKLIAASNKRKERIAAAEAALNKPAEEEPPPPPVAPVAPPEPAPAAAASSDAPTVPVEPTEVAPVFSLAAVPHLIAPLDVAVDAADPLLAMLAGQAVDLPAVRELLHGGWVRAHYAHRMQCPEAVARWLFDVACNHKSAETSAAAARTLGALLDGTASSSTSVSWAPTPSDFLSALRRHGAALAELAPAAADASGAGEAGAENKDEVDDPREALLATLELLPPSARRWGAVGAEARPSVPERLGAARWLARLMLEPHAAAAFVHLQDAFAATLDGAPETEWASAWLPGLRSELTKLCQSLPHTAVVRVLEFLPPTRRAVAVQRHLAIDAIAVLHARRAKQHKAAEKRVEVGMYRGRMDVLHSLLVLTNVALAAEPHVMREDREALEGLRRRLGSLKHGAQRYRGAIDYHGLECESLASYLGNKVELLFLSGGEEA